MKFFIVIPLIFLFCVSCDHKSNKEQLKQEVLKAEKSFEKMGEEKGIAEAFYFFADDSAVIKRENDTLILGKENIKKYHSGDFYKTASVKWAPDFIDVSDDGSMAYTYGKYIWTSIDENGSVAEFKGVFHTVWKRQKDKSWKYVWD